MKVGTVRNYKITHATHTKNLARNIPPSHPLRVRYQSIGQGTQYAKGYFIIKGRLFPPFLFCAPCTFTFFRCFPLLQALKDNSLPPCDRLSLFALYPLSAPLFMCPPIVSLAQFCAM